MREHVRPVTDEVAAQRPALYWVLPVREDAEGLVAEARRDPASAASTVQTRARHERARLSRVAAKLAAAEEEAKAKAKAEEEKRRGEEAEKAAKAAFLVSVAQVGYMGEGVIEAMCNAQGRNPDGSKVSSVFSFFLFSFSD